MGLAGSQAGGLRRRAMHSGITDNEAEAGTVTTIRTPWRTSDGRRRAHRDRVLVPTLARLLPAAYTLLEFSSPMKGCMTPRDKMTLESPPG